MFRFSDVLRVVWSETTFFSGRSSLAASASKTLPTSHTLFHYQNRTLYIVYSLNNIRRKPSVYVASQPFLSVLATPKNPERRSTGTAEHRITSSNYVLAKFPPPEHVNKTQAAWHMTRVKREPFCLVVMSIFPDLVPRKYLLASLTLPLTDPY